MNRKMPYGYQIQSGMIVTQSQEAAGVKRIFSLYLAGKSRDQIADALNTEGYCYSAESPKWDKNRVRQALENPRYMGAHDYPAIIADETFRMAEAMKEKRTRKRGNQFFTMGGASSHDIQDGILEPNNPLFKKKCRELDARGAMYRVNHLSWWKNELPSEDEYQTARASLDRAGWEVDYILTHCCPTSVQDIFSGGLYQRDALTEFFDEVRQRCRFKYWFFGHYHEDMVIEKKYVMLYEQIIKLKL